MSQVIEVLPDGIQEPISRVSCQKGPTRHAYAWQIGDLFGRIPSIYTVKSVPCMLMSRQCKEPGHQQKWFWHICPRIFWAPFQYLIRRLIVRSHEDRKPQDWQFKLSHRFEIRQALGQQCCRDACQILERSDNSKYKSCVFETSRDLTIRHLVGYWDRALASVSEWLIS